MDKEQLKQLRYIRSEIEVIKKQMLDLDYTVATDKVRGSSSHFPYVKRSFTIEGVNYEEYNHRLQTLKNKLDKRIKELVALAEETNEFIESIDDSLVRQIITLRYVRGLTWEQVAVRIEGNNTADSVRKIAERFLK